MALVPRYADSCHWNRAGWLAGPRRPLHLSSTNRIGHRARLVDLGSDEIVLAAPERFGQGGATTKNYIERCRCDRSHHVVELVLETNDALACYRSVMATQDWGHAGKRCRARGTR